MKDLLIRLAFASWQTFWGVGPPVCRFEPTCSRYARESILRHGWIRGAFLALCRLARCRPGGESGWDPVPP